jgi:4a-hydroxytetrahydrobiopterin dehydratase
MTDVSKLPDSEIQNHLSALNQIAVEKWQLTDGKLHKQFKFTDFNAAMAFMQSAGEMAEEINHHPEWCNVYNRVTVDLVTHSVNGLSVLDFKLANALEKLS